MTARKLTDIAMQGYQRLLPQLRQLVTQEKNPAWGLAPLVQLPTVGQMLQMIQPLPADSVLIGACEDGLPFLLDLSEPANGSVLVTGDPGSGKTRQLQAVVDSAVRALTPRKLQVGVISSRPDEWQDLFAVPQRARHLLGLAAWDGRLAEDLITYLVKLCEDRREGRRNGAHVLLIVDDLSPIHGMPYEVQSGLHHLIQYGPEVGIWPLVSLDAARAVEMDFWVNAFRTRLIGRVASDSLAQHLAIFEINLVGQLLPGAEFCVWMGHEWMKYWVPALGE